MNSVVIARSRVRAGSDGFQVRQVRDVGEVGEQARVVAEIGLQLAQLRPELPPGLSVERTGEHRGCHFTVNGRTFWFSTTTAIRVKLMQ
jgi:hypothetical protein